MSRAARNSLKLSLMTIISRILGLVRDHFQAVFFGTGAIATAWEVAYMLPNMLRNLLAEGIMSQAFIPIYSEALKESEEAAKKRAAVVLGFLLLFVGFLVVIGILTFPYLLPLYTDKSRDEAALMIALARIMFVFIMTASLTAILSGIANTKNEFVIPAISPILLNLVFISGFVLLSISDFKSEKNAMILAWFVVFGGLIQFLSQVFFLKYRGWWPGITFRINDPALKKIFMLMAPAILGASLFQINQMTDIAIASYFIPEQIGAIPALRYAHRLIQLPTGVIGVALSTAILPALVEAIRNDNHEKNGEELVAALAFSLFLTVPAGIGLFFLGPDILNLLFFGGAWSLKSTGETWIALQFFVLGVPFYSMNKILTSSFYAYQDTKTPVRILMGVVIINFLLNLVLVQFLYQGGIALSSALTALLNSSLLLYSLRKRVGEIPWKRFFNLVVRMLILWILISSFLALLRFSGSDLVKELLSGILTGSSLRLLPRYSGLVMTLLGVAGTGFLYIGGSVVLNIEQMRIFTSVLNKKRNRSKQ